MSKDKNTQQFVPANIKITKGMAQQAMELGITHVNFRNKGLQKRLLKDQKELDKRRQRNENSKRKLIKDYEKAKATKPVGGGEQLTKEEYMSVVERVMSVSPQPGPLEEVHGLGNGGANFKNMREAIADSAETPEQAAKRVMDILGFSGSEDDQSEAASLENTYEACLDIRAARIKPVDIDIAATYPGPDTTPEELQEAIQKVSGGWQDIPELAGIDPTLPFDDGTIDTNDDPKNFGVQSVDNDAEEAQLPTNVTRNADGSVILHDVKTGWRTKLSAHMVDRNKLSLMMDVAELEAIAKYLPLDLSVQIINKLELAKAVGVTQVETPQELLDYWTSCIGNDDVTRMYPNILQPIVHTFSHATVEGVMDMMKEVAKEANKPQVLDIATGEIRETTGHVVDGKFQYIDDKPKDDSSDKE